MKVVINKDYTKYKIGAFIIIMILTILLFINSIDNEKQQDTSNNLITKERLTTAAREYEILKIKEKINSLKLNAAYRELAESIYDATRHYGVPENIAIALGYRESGYRQFAVSYADCVGYFQLNPAAHSWIDNDQMFDTRYNVFGGMRILSEYRQLSERRFGEGHSDLFYWEMALIHYNGWVPGSEFGKWVLYKVDKLKSNDIQ